MQATHVLCICTYLHTCICTYCILYMYILHTVHVHTRIQRDCQGTACYVRYALWSQSRATLGLFNDWRAQLWLNLSNGDCGSTPWRRSTPCTLLSGVSTKLLCLPNKVSCLYSEPSWCRKSAICFTLAPVNLSTAPVFGHQASSSRSMPTHTFQYAVLVSHQSYW